MKEQVAARLAHETVDHGQSEPGSLSDFLGREEGLNGAAKDVVVHAGAIVAHLDPNKLHVPSSRLFGIVLEQRGVRADLQPPAARHGVASVDGEVEKRV